MPLTQNFKATIQARIERDPAFREKLLKEGVECVLACAFPLRRGSLRLPHGPQPRRRAYLRIINQGGGSRLLDRGGSFLHCQNESLVPMTEATAQIKINRLLESAGWRFIADRSKSANIRLEPNVTVGTSSLDARAVRGLRLSVKLRRGTVDDDIVKRIVIGDCDIGMVRREGFNEPCRKVLYRKGGKEQPFEGLYVDGNVFSRYWQPWLRPARAEHSFDPADSDLQYDSYRKLLFPWSLTRFSESARAETSR